MKANSSVRLSYLLKYNLAFIVDDNRIVDFVVSVIYVATIGIFNIKLAALGSI